MRRALHCLSLLLLPALAPDGVQALPRSRPPGSGPVLRNAEPIPYLPTAGAPPLRFQETPLPPEPVAPPAKTETTATLTSPEASVAAANAAAAQSTHVAAEPASEAAAPANDPAAAAPAPADPLPAATKTPPSILPDHARPVVRPEDFLPYFQIPGSAQNPRNVTLLVPAAPGTPPAPATLPPSSASYTQSPQ